VRHSADAGRLACVVMLLLSKGFLITTLTAKLPCHSWQQLDFGGSTAAHMFEMHPGMSDSSIERTRDAMQYCLIRLILGFATYVLFGPAMQVLSTRSMSTRM